MHTRNISVLQDEAQRLLALESDILGKMLDHDAILGQDKAGARGTFTRTQTVRDKETLQGERHKLESLELVIAVVGTMKAGKSTTINAIVGTEVLPNRNRPMTALPTLIRHTQGQIEPVLEFANSAPVERLVGQLRAAAARADKRAIVASLQQDKDMAALLRHLDNGTPFSAEYRGAERIFDFLRTLNDLVRLSADLDIPFPFEDYSGIHEIPVIKVEFAHLRDSAQAQGTLTLLDTPGPNEAGQPHLRRMLREQLARASAVLAVLDFTQLKSEADAQIQAELKDIADVAAGRMYALVNKFDEADRNSDSADEVRRFVSETLTEGRIGIDAIFPVSSRRAYLANRARTSLALTQALPSADEQAWVADFGEEAHGQRWRKLIGDPVEDREAADDLWESSLFAAPVNDVIRFAQGRAAILALGSAASKLVDTADRLGNFFNTRQTALGKSSRELQAQIQALQDDIERVEVSESGARKDADARLKDLKKQSDQMLREVKRQVATAIEQIFSARKQEEEANAQAEREAAAPVASSWMGFFVQALAGARRDHERPDSPYMDPDKPVMSFSSRTEAEAKLQAIQKELGRIVQSGEANMKDSMSSALAHFHEHFSEQVLGRARGILDEMRSRLKDDGFDLRLDIPKADTLSLPASGASMLGDLISEKTETRSKRRRQDGAWGTVCGWFGTDDWGWEEYSVDVDVYEIDSRTIKTAIGKDIDAVFAGLNEALAEKIRTPLEKGINQFFRAFKETVEHIRGDLLQGKADIDKTKAEQEDLLRRLVALNQHLPAIQSDSEGLKRDIDDSATQVGRATA